MSLQSAFHCIETQKLHYRILILGSFASKQNQDRRCPQNSYRGRQVPSDTAFTQQPLTKIAFLDCMLYEKIRFISILRLSDLNWGQTVTTQEHYLGAELFLIIGHYRHFKDFALTMRLEQKFAAFLCSKVDHQDLAASKVLSS